MKTPKMPSTRLKLVGKKIESLDQHLIHLLERRIHLSEEVAMIKLEEGEPFIRRSVEIKRLKMVSDLGRRGGIDRDFVRSILYSIIGESCKAQAIIADKVRVKGKKFERFKPSLKDLRENLLTLTNSWAHRYDSEYGKQFPATLDLADFEHDLIDKIIVNIDDRSLLLDIGCATGKEMRRISNKFEKLQGFDISPKMVEFGQNAVANEGIKNISFAVHDVETRWPIEDASVSLVIMNGGTGSDVSDIKFVLSEIRRVLKPGGQFVISFYNKEAWTQRAFMPWPLGLVASVDQDRECLEVRIGKKLIPIYAKSYTSAEIESMMPNHLSVIQSATYPTISSILPADVLFATKSPALIKELETVINGANLGLGAYVVVSGRKT